nr:MAG TPA: hypothetical protein [Caudoviricetes sp.]DAN90384.1 MAG TPA: hypothetical protein [Bacteriophage sp.]
MKIRSRRVTASILFNWLSRRKVVTDLREL